MNVGIRFFNGQTDWGWVCEQVPILRVEDTGGLVAFNEDTSELLGACIWDNWTKNSVQCHFILTNPIVVKHGFIGEITDYIFNHQGKRFIYGLVPADNEKALKINKKFGFTEKTRLTDAWADGVDYVLMELKRENCPYFTKIEAA
jgi:RimJ/RimL family protein N-acetyltransferase